MSASRGRIVAARRRTQFRPQPAALMGRRFPRAPTSVAGQSREHAPVGAARLRLPPVIIAEICRHLLQQLLQERHLPIVRRCRRSTRCSSQVPTALGIKLVVDPLCRPGRHSARRLRHPVPDRCLPQGMPAQWLGRYRPDPAPRREDPEFEAKRSHRPAVAVRTGFKENERQRFVFCRVTASVPEITAEALRRPRSALDLKFEMEEALLGGAPSTRPANRPRPPKTGPRRRRCHPLGAVGGPQWDNAAARAAPERPAGHPQGSQPVRQPAPGHPLPGTGQCLDLKPEVVAGLDILIIRELTGDIYFGQPRGVREETASASASTPWSTANRKSAASPCRLRCGPEAQPEAVLGRQDERARMHPALARRDDRDAPTTRMSNCPTCWSITPRCNWSRPPSSST